MSDNKAKVTAKPATKKAVKAAAKPRTQVAAKRALTDEQKSTVHSILADTIIFQIAVGKPSWNKRLTSDERKLVLARKGSRAEEAQAYLKLGKELLPREAMRPIRALDAQAKAWLRGLALPNSILGGGAFLFALDHGKAVMDYLTQYETQRAELIEQFIATDYPAAKRERMEEDAELFTEGDYLTGDQLRKKFFLEIEAKSEEVPQAKLRSIGARALKTALDRAESKWASIADEVRDGLRLGYAALIQRASQQLSFNDGEPRVFRDSLVEDLLGFVTTFEGRNKLNDEQLAKMVAQLRDVMAGVSPEVLRQDMDVRNRVLKATEKIAGQLEKAGVTVKKVRKIRDVEADEEEAE